MLVLNKKTNATSIFVVILIAFLSIVLRTNAQSPCIINDPTCEPAYGNSIDFLYTDLDNYPDCPIHIVYQVMNCNNVTYFRLVSIYFESGGACDALVRDLVPFGWGNYADGRALSRLWRDAFSQLSQNYFANMNHANYLCPAKYTCKTITPGGCNAAFLARKLIVSTNPQRYLYHMMYAPCETDGCCINTVEMCWDNSTQSVQKLKQSFQYGSSENCNGKVPLYNPFSDPIYNAWEKNPPSPCQKSCYIDN